MERLKRETDEAIYQRNPELIISTIDEIFSRKKVIKKMAGKSKHKKPSQNAKIVCNSEMCVNLVSGICQYGKDCSFAHTIAELRPREMSAATYKMNFHDNPGMKCPYGERCHYIHDEVAWLVGPYKVLKTGTVELGNEVYTIIRRKRALLEIVKIHTWPLGIDSVHDHLRFHLRGIKHVFPSCKPNVPPPKANKKSQNDQKKKKSRKSSKAKQDRNPSSWNEVLEEQSCKVIKTQEISEKSSLEAASELFECKFIERKSSTLDENKNLENNSKSEVQKPIENRNLSEPQSTTQLNHNIPIFHPEIPTIKSPPSAPCFFFNNINVDFASTEMPENLQMPSPSLTPPPIMSPFFPIPNPMFVNVGCVTAEQPSTASNPSQIRELSPGASIQSFHANMLNHLGCMSPEQPSSPPTLSPIGISKPESEFSFPAPTSHTNMMAHLHCDHRINPFIPPNASINASHSNMLPHAPTSPIAFNPVSNSIANINDQPRYTSMSPQPQLSYVYTSPTPEYIPAYADKLIYQTGEATVNETAWISDFENRINSQQTFINKASA